MSNTGQDSLPYTTASLVRLITVTVVVYCSAWFACRAGSHRLICIANSNAANVRMVIVVLTTPQNSNRLPARSNQRRVRTKRQRRKIAERLIEAGDGGLSAN